MAPTQSVDALSVAGTIAGRAGASLADQPRETSRPYKVGVHFRLYQPRRKGHPGDRHRRGKSDQTPASRSFPAPLRLASSPALASLGKEAEHTFMDMPVELQAAVNAADGTPLEIVNPRTNEHFVLIRADFYERIKSLLEYDEPTADEQTSLIQEIAKSAGWEDASADGLI